MQYSESWAQLVPSARDPENLNEPLAQSAFARAQSELLNLGVPVQLDALYWTFRIAEETAQLDALASRVPWLDRIAVGFIDPETDGTGPAFGVICYTNVPETADVQIPPIDQLGGIDAGPYFPAVMRVGARTSEVSITSPSTAMAATWATSGRTQSGGWLVPSHAVDLHSGVTFSDGSTGAVTESWGSCIDAVLVTPSSGGPPPGTSIHQSVRGIAAGTTVTVYDRNLAFHTATVLDVDINLGVVRHQLFPIRFSYDWTTSAPGDSGALVTASPCGEPLGMHQGCFKWRPASAPPTQHAYALCLYQLEDYGGLEVYQ